MRTLIIAAVAATSLLSTMNSAIAEDQRNPVWDIYPSYQLSITSNLPRNPADSSFIAAPVVPGNRGIVVAPLVTGSIGVVRRSPQLEPGVVDLREWQLQNSAR